MRRRSCLAIDLRDQPEAIAEYDRIHKPGGVWLEVLTDLRANGYEHMSIWRTGNRLFMIAEIETPTEPPTHGAALQAVLDRWQSLTQGLQQALPGTGDTPRWIEMNCLFNLDEHA